MDNKLFFTQRICCRGASTIFYRLNHMGATKNIGVAQQKQNFYSFIMILYNIGYLNNTGERSERK